MKATMESNMVKVNDSLNTGTDHKYKPIDAPNQFSEYINANLTRGCKIYGQMIGNDRPAYNEDGTVKDIIFIKYLSFAAADIVEKIKGITGTKDNVEDIDTNEPKLVSEPYAVHALKSDYDEAGNEIISRAGTIGCLSGYYKDQPFVIVTVVLFGNSYQYFIGEYKVIKPLLEDLMGYRDDKEPITCTNGQYTVSESNGGLYLVPVKERHIVKTNLNKDNEAFNTLLDTVNYRLGDYLVSLEEKRKMIESLMTNSDIDDELKEIIESYGEQSNTTLKANTNIVLAGPVGTGKTTMLQKLAEMKESTHFICWVQSLQQAVFAFEQAEKSKVSAIVFYEECDTELGATSESGVNAKGYVKNVLDGNMTVYNPKGSVLILVTNHKDVFAKDHMNRPGRIYKIITVPPLSGKQALNAFRFHLMPITKGISEDLKDHIVNKGSYTADELKHAAEQCKAMLTNLSDVVNVKEIELSMFNKIIEEFIEERDSDPNRQAFDQDSKSKVGFRK